MMNISLRAAALSTSFLMCACHVGESSVGGTQSSGRDSQSDGRATRAIESTDRPDELVRSNPTFLEPIVPRAENRPAMFHLASTTVERAAVPVRTVAVDEGSDVRIEAFEFVEARARELASLPYEAEEEAPAFVRELDYDEYRRIEYRRDAAIFGAPDRPFRVMLDSRGSLFQSDVTINTLSESSLNRVDYDPDRFNFHDLELTPEQQAELGHAGFRVLAPLNEAGRFDEVLSVKGASFFRALGAGNHYGASARGIAVNTASALGEEFPVFTEFWLQAPSAADEAFVFYALMDGPSVTGAYQFRVDPGSQTLVDVEAVIFAREDTEHVGIAPLTSMFEFAPHDPQTSNTDFRPRVHDSEGLSVMMSNGEWIWRPLTNPGTLQISSFTTDVPVGFGLSQRTRSFEDFQDIEAEYQLRPNVWITPRGGWPDGSLSLVEIPTPNEYNDNIISYWRLAEPLQAGERLAFAYQMEWGMDMPINPPTARVHATRTGISEVSGRRLFLVDFKVADLERAIDWDPVVSASEGEIENVTITPDPRSGVLRLSFELAAAGGSNVELRALLNSDGQAASETWLYRWSPA